MHAPQAICATTPAFVAALALLMLRQRETRGVYLALVPVVAGLMLATGAEPSFDAFGFAATIAATVLRALKTVLQVRVTCCSCYLTIPECLHYVRISASAERCLASLRSFAMPQAEALHTHSSVSKERLYRTIDSQRYLQHHSDRQFDQKLASSAWHSPHSTLISHARRRCS